MMFVEYESHKRANFDYYYNAENSLFYKLADIYLNYRFGKY